MPSDEELMLAVAGGELSAFEQLVARHQQSAWSAAYRFLGDTTDAEDIVQEAFLRILHSAERWRPTAAFRTYLFRVVYNLCHDLARKKRPHISDVLDKVADPRPSPDESATAGEQIAAIRAALSSLPPNQRMAIVLRYYHDVGHEEIAAVLHTSAKGAERLLARGRAALRATLGEWLRE
jgi:RNA polymerase sigma-70 factor (ECF subfamily)